MKVKELIKYEEKSKIKAGEAVENGKYPFFTSSEAEDKRYNDYTCDTEGIIMGTGGNATLHYCNGKFAVSTDCLVLKTNDKVNCKYLYYFFKANMNILQAGFKGAGLKHTNKNYIENIELSRLPDINQQKQIVCLIDKIELLVKKHNYIINYLDTLIKARFVEMFGDVIQSKYELKTLQQLVNKRKDSIKRGPFGGSLKKDDFVNDGYLVYEQRHAIHNDFKYEKYYINKEKYNEMIGFKVEPGDLIISCSGVTLGRIAEIPNNAKKGIINQALLKISLDKKIMNNKFFIQQFRSKVIQEKLFGFSRGSGIPNMPSMEEVKKVKFICPPVELQEEYSRFVNEVDKLKFE